MPRIVEPSEVADLLRRFAELQHDLTALRLAFELHPGVLPRLAALAVLAVESSLQEAMEGLQHSARLLTTALTDC